jgi:hypothetical protein
MMTHLQQAIAAERLKGLFDEYELGILEDALTEYVRSSNEDIYKDIPNSKRITADRIKAVVMEAKGV